MLYISLKIKPLSVNECWQGKRFKTKEYKNYERFLFLSLPHFKLPDPPFRVYFSFGLSNSCADFDNPIKPLTDILQKKYKFNDRDIHEANIRKVKVKKGEEYFSVRFETIEP